MKWFGQIVGVDPDRIGEYAKHHDEIWPEIVDALRVADIRNYSIFFQDDLLFAYFEYHGPDDDFDQRMAAIAEAPRMEEWWSTVGPMQRPFADREPGEFWKNMRCVFHLD